MKMRLTSGQVVIAIYGAKMGPHRRARYSSASGWPALARSDQLKHIRVSRNSV